MRSNKDKFIAEWAEFEDYLKDTYNTDSWNIFHKLPDLKMYTDDIVFYRNVRNFLVHDLVGEELDELFVVNKELLRKFKIFKEEFVMRAEDRMIPVEKMYCRSTENSVMPTIQYMREKDYTSVPISKDGALLGVFNANVLMDLTADGLVLTEETKFADIENYFADQNVYETAGAAETIPALKVRFANARKDGHRLDLLVVTDTGKTDGAILGFITAWDIAAV